MLQNKGGDSIRITDCSCSFGMEEITHCSASYFVNFLVLPSDLQPFVGCGFLGQVIPSPAIESRFFLIIHILQLHMITHIIQPSYLWSSYPSTPLWFLV